MRDIAFVKGLYSQGGAEAATAYVLEKADANFGSVGGNYADYVTKRLGGGETSEDYNIDRRIQDNPNYISPEQTPNVPKFITVPITNQ